MAFPLYPRCLLKIICRFLLVSLNIDAILGGVTIGQRRKKLEEMARGKGLSDAYTATLTRLKAQKGTKSELGLKVLMWVLKFGAAVTGGGALLCSRSGDKI